MKKFLKHKFDLLLIKIKFNTYFFVFSYYFVSLLDIQINYFLQYQHFIIINDKYSIKKAD